MADRMYVRLRGGTFDGWLFWAPPRRDALSLPVSEGEHRRVEIYEYTVETDDDGRPIMQHRSTQAAPRG